MGRKPSEMDYIKTCEDERLYLRRFLLKLIFILKQILINKFFAFIF
jgi:hypothetical protein